MDSFTTGMAAYPQDFEFMQLAIQEAHKSSPVDKAYCVGACIVKDNVLLSTGYSRELEGNTHAEECALFKLTDPGIAEGATMYTTMEPCSTRLSGNRPCTDRIIEAKIARVVLGVREPPDLVNCDGVKLLEQAGITVETVPGVEKQCLAPNQHVLRRSADHL